MVDDEEFLVLEGRDGGDGGLNWNEMGEDSGVYGRIGSAEKNCR